MQQPLNPIKVTAQAGHRENWATAGTGHLANHPPEEKEEINQLKQALKDLAVFTDHHRGEPGVTPNPYLYKVFVMILSMSY